MICKYCGNQIDDNSDFCFICGQKVEQNNDQNSFDETAPADNYAVQSEAVAVMPESPAIFEESLPDTAKASKFVRVISFIFAIIGLIIYAKKKKNGKEGEAISVLNAVMTGLCVKMGIAIIYLVKTFMINHAAELTVRFD